MKARAVYLSLLTLAATPALADPDKHEHGKKHHHEGGGIVVQERTTVTTTTTRSGSRQPWLRFTISEPERVRLREYYTSTPQRDYRELPPGLAKKARQGRPLPPGWQKKLRRGQPMDAVVLGHARPLPVTIIEQLPPQPEGTILVDVDGRIVRLYEATRTIIDILEL